MYNQNDIEYLKDMMQQKKITAAEANVELVLMQRVMVIEGRIPADVRAALNAAVKSGVLAHLKKDGLRPEAYYHPNFKHQAVDARNHSAECAINAIRRVCI